MIEFKNLSIELSIFPYLDNSNCGKRDWYRGPTTTQQRQSELDSFAEYSCSSLKDSQNYLIKRIKLQ
jgi:hypothetical protein